METETDDVKVEADVKIEYVVTDVPDIDNCIHEEVITEASSAAAAAVAAEGIEGGGGDGNVIYAPQHVQEEIVEHQEYYEEAYIADPGDMVTETVLSSSEDGTHHYVTSGGTPIFEETVVTNGMGATEEDIIDDNSENPDIQTAIDLAKFSQSEAKIIASSPQNPQRYIILQYPNGTSHRVMTTTASVTPNNSGGCSTNKTTTTTTNTNQFRKAPLKLLSSGDPNGKPKLSYAAMISEVIKAAPEQRLTLSEIYQAISNKYPYYKMDIKNWQNSIRHNLSLNHSFVKVPRPENKGRGHYWTIDPTKEKAFRRHSAPTSFVLSSSASPSSSSGMSSATTGIKTLVQQQKSRGSTTTTYQIVTLPPGATLE